MTTTQINEDDDYNDENVVLATYVEPPELPTKTTHKVFGALFISLLSLSDETSCLSIIHEQRERRRHHSRVYIYIYIFDVTQNTDNDVSSLPSFSTLFIATDD